MAAAASTCCQCGHLDTAGDSDLAHKKIIVMPSCEFHLYQELLVIAENMTLYETKIVFCIFVGSFQLPPGNKEEKFNELLPT